jgi:hypothetical protein
MFFPSINKGIRRDIFATHSLSINKGIRRDIFATHSLSINKGIRRDIFATHSGEIRSNYFPEIYILIHKYIYPSISNV